MLVYHGEGECISIQIRIYNSDVFIQGVVVNIYLIEYLETNHEVFITWLSMMR